MVKIFKAAENIEFALMRDSHDKWACLL